MPAQTYEQVISTGREVLNGAGFSDAEVGAFLREYEKDHELGNGLDYIRRRIERSAQARIARRARLGENQRNPTAHYDADASDSAQLKGLAALVTVGMPVGVGVVWGVGMGCLAIAPAVVIGIGIYVISDD
ncbi:MAG: hypothetical protein ABH864_03905 [archaeon]